MSTPTPGPPYVGALLRKRFESVRARLLGRLREAGFEVTLPQFSLLGYPGPDGRRPSELAAAANLSKQAANYLLAQLEEKGYLERRDADGGRRVFLTAAGRRMQQLIWDASREIEAEWQAAVGAQRYAEFRAALQRLPELATTNNVKRVAPRQ